MGKARNIADLLNSSGKIDSADIDSSAQFYQFKNRIINGAMVIDQRNAGAAVTTSSTYVTDRFTQAFSNASCSFQQVSDAPSGFINSLKLTVTTGSAPSAGTNNVILQKIEGSNVFDFAFGSASASSFTLSFWVKGSVIGTYAVSLTNSAFNRSYVATYTINVANTWEQKTITVAGDTTGTWLTTNGVGLTVLWDFGSGTNLNTTAGSWQAGNYYRTSGCTTIASTTNATLQITGVQLEKGSTATSFDYRPYGTELALCQRYYQQYDASESGAAGAGAIGVCGATNVGVMSGTLQVTMRASATIAFNNLTLNYGGATVPVSSITTYSSQKALGMDITASSSPMTVGRACVLQFSGGQSSANKITYSAEL